jgi:histone deacetylase complex regulatory component SIN3
VTHKMFLIQFIYGCSRFKGKLFKLLNGSTDNSNFEDYCLNFLGPRSYVLFTLDKLIWQVINQVSKAQYAAHKK